MNLIANENVIHYIRKQIKAARNIVAILGIEMLVEGGGYDLDTNEETYRVEEEYGYSPEDILSTSFFNAKVEKFFQFYKKEILGMNLKNTAGYDALLKLQSQGKLSAVINQNFHGMPEHVFFNNVIELNGSIYSNTCPRCSKSFDLHYVKSSRGVPQCENCKIGIRPKIRLMGERINTKFMTEAATVCEKADILLILGKNMYHDRIGYRAGADRKQLRVLFSKEAFLPEREADYVIRDEIQTVLPLLVD